MQHHHGTVLGGRPGRRLLGEDRAALRGPVVHDVALDVELDVLELADGLRRGDPAHVGHPLLGRTCRHERSQRHSDHHGGRAHLHPA